MSNKDCLIVGCGSQAHSVISIIESTGKYNIKGLVDTAEQYDEHEEIMGYFVMSSIQKVIESWSIYSNYDFFLAIGNNEKRQEIFNILDDVKASLPNVIASSSVVSRTAVLGRANIVGHFCLLGPNSKLGNDNLINNGVILEHDSAIGDANHLAPKSALLGNASIGDRCFVGAGSVIKDKLTIADQVTIGAGSVVLKDITKMNVTMYGVPAKEKVVR